MQLQGGLHQQYEKIQRAQAKMEMRAGKVAAAGNRTLATAQQAGAETAHTHNVGYHCLPTYVPIW